MAKLKRKIDLPREVLLIEIERRCAACDLKNRIGLTKDDARQFVGFKCEPCQHWNDDVLREHDVPEWWEELKITGLHGLRLQEYERADAAQDFDADEFDDAEDVNKVLRRELREMQEEIDETTSAQVNVATDETRANDEARELQRLLEIVRRRKREEKLF